MRFLIASEPDGILLSPGCEYYNLHVSDGGSPCDTVCSDDVPLAFPSAELIESPPAIMLLPVQLI